MASMMAISVGGVGRVDSYDLCNKPPVAAGMRFFCRGVSQRGAVVEEGVAGGLLSLHELIVFQAQFAM